MRHPLNSRFSMLRQHLLTLQFIFLVGALFATALGINTWQTLQQQNREYQTQLKNTALLLGQFSAEMSAEAILAYDFVELNRLAQELTYQPDVIYSVFTDNKGEAISSYLNRQEPLIANAHQQIGSDDLMRTIALLQQDTHLLHFQFPIQHHHDNLGYLHLALNTRRIETLVRQNTITRIIHHSVMISLLGIILFFIFRSKIVLPINTLIAASQRIAAGNFAEAVPVHSQNELGDLSLAFNQMQAQLHYSRLEAAAQRQKTEQALALAQEQTRLLEQQSLELQFAMAEAEKATQTKNRFLATMTHELRTPLNAIIGFSELLCEDLASTPEHAHLLADAHKIQLAGRHLLAVINDILDISKIEAGQMKLQIQTFPVPSLLQEVANTLQPLIAKNNNTLNIVIDPTLGNMTADLAKVRQILINLLGNAAKFCDNGTISLQAKPILDPQTAQPAICFQVCDEGIGMSPDQLENLFQPFTQADNSYTRKYDGTGLGLAITKEFVSLMGGHIHVSSALGQGSTFLVLLPQNSAIRP